MSGALSPQREPFSRVAVTGLGAVSCLGLGVEAAWQSVAANRSGVVNGIGSVDDEFLLQVPEELRRNRALALSWLSAREALARSGWRDLSEVGLIVATTTGQLLQWDSMFMAMARGEAAAGDVRSVFHNQPLSTLMSGLARSLSLGGPSTLLTSACSASTQALGVGAMWIRQGRVKRCLVVGSEVLSDLTTEGFRCLQLLSTESCTPFDQNRKGINLSEASAALCLERLEGAQVPALAELAGFGFSTDGYHMTGPHPEGDGCVRAMRAALKVSGITPADVDWVFAHGTGSQQNDLAEGLAVLRLFGANGPWVSSTKWLHGHALAAAGALESVLLVKALHEGLVLATRGLKQPDSRIPVRHPTSDLRVPLRYVVKSTLGFGGTNAALVFKAAEVQP